MHRVYQQTYDDCLKCCVASILDMEYDQVPDFNRDETVMEFFQWLYKNTRYAILPVSIDGDTIEEREDWWPFKGKEIYHIRSFDVGDGLSHAVVCKSGKIVHDPNPDPGEYKGYLHDYFFIDPMNKC